MNRILITIVLLLSIQYSQSSYVHQCNHNDFAKPIYHPIQTENEIINHRRRTQSWQPIRILPVFKALDEFVGQTDPLNRYIKRLVKVGIDFYAEQLTVVRESKNITFVYDSVNNEKCNTYSVTDPIYNTQGVDYDLVIFITAEKNIGSTVLASAAACRLTNITNRPIYGQLNFNTASLENIDYSDFDFKDHLYTTLHEMLHILVFSPGLFQYYQDSSGKQVVLETVYNNVTNFIISPNVKAKAREFFNCNNLDGMPLEDNGGEGSAKAHWERNAVKNEIMTASSVSGDMYFSKMTFALLQDSGWYHVNNIELGETQQWGYKKGCDFVLKSCSSTDPTYTEFCATSNTQTISCNFEQIGFGTCQKETFTSTCAYWNIANHYLCTDERNQKYQYGQVTGETYGRSSRCFSSSLNLKTGPSYGFNNKCYKSTCSDDKLKINIFVGQEQVTCDTNGKVMTGINNYNGNLICPTNITQFCSMIQYCPNNCNQLGVCMNGQCLCYQGSAKINNTCVTNCKSDEYYDSALNSCQACSTNCASCKIANNICTSCKTGFFLSNKQCSSGCPQPTYQNNVTNSCDQTINNCTVYTSATQCKTCALGAFLSNDTTFCSNYALQTQSGSGLTPTNNTNSTSLKKFINILTFNVIILLIILGIIIIS